MAIERSQGFRQGGREAEADVAIWTDQDHATRRNTRTCGIDIGIVGDLHERGRTPIKPGELLGGRHRPKNKQVMRPTTELRSVRVALPRMRFRGSV